MLTRREFIGAAIGATAAAPAFALPADRFRWAINTNMFTPLKPHPETGFKMAARFGFHGVEPWANQMQQYFAQPPEVFKKLLDESGVGISRLRAEGVFRHCQTAGHARRPRRERQVRNISALRRSRRISITGSAREPQSRERQDPREKPQRSRQAHTRTRRQVCVSSTRLDDRRAQGGSGDDPGDDRSQARLPHTRHLPRVGGRDGAGDFRARPLFAHRASALQRHAASVECGEGLARSAPDEEEETRVARQHGLAPSRHAIYQSFGAGGVDFPALIGVLRERHYDGWISLDFNAVDLPPGVSVEQEMTAHRKYLVETLHATMRR